MTKPDLYHLAADMHARARALRQEADQLDVDADALHALVMASATATPTRPQGSEVKWIDAGSLPLGEAAAMLGNLIGGEPRMHCNMEDYTRAGLQGVRSRILLAHGHGWLIPRTDIPAGRVVSG